MRTRILAVALLSFLAAAQARGANLLTNPGAETGDLGGWTILTNGGNGWNVSGNAHSGQYSSITSYFWDIRAQTIDLVEKGLLPADLDDPLKQPPIEFGHWVRGTWPNYADHHYLHVELQDAAGDPLAIQEFGSQLEPLRAMTEWQWFGGVFDDYPQGVRNVYFEQGGYDAEYWAGNYGAIFDDAYVSAVPEPASAWLLAVGLVELLAARRRNKG